MTQKLPLRFEMVLAKVNGIAAALADENRLYSAGQLREAERELRKLIAAQIDALAEAEEYFDNRADADCEGDPLRFVPNAEMRLAQTMREASR